MRLWTLLLPLATTLLVSCGGGGSYRNFGPSNMGGPTAEVRSVEIANEASGDFYYARRYFVHKTRFWGYLRKPHQDPRSGKLVIMNETRKHVPDRLPEDGPPGQRWGYDQNYEYRVRGSYSGRTLYDPNSNQFLPEFVLTDYELVNRNPGWLFSPKDHYDPYTITLLP